MRPGLRSHWQFLPASGNVASTSWDRGTRVTIRLAIIGAGIMGADHARIFAEDLSGAEIAVVCDADEGRARDVADRHGIATAMTDPEAALARDDVDAVVVASPDETHAPLTLACIRAGKPVLCEKPLSQDPGECRAVIDAEVAVGRRFVQVGFMRRYDPAYEALKSALDTGRLGRALMMHNLHRNVVTPEWFTGAMAITNSAPHEFDVARHVLETELVGVTAVQPRRSDDRVAPVVLTFETADGQIVTVEVNNNAAYGYDVRGELVGETGSMDFGTPVRARAHADLEAREPYDADWRGRFFEAYRRQNKAFLAFCRTGRFPAIAADAWDGMIATIVAQAGVRALASGAWTTIELPDRPALYDGGRA